MIELIQSLPSLSLQRGITHSWMRETSVVDGDVLVMTMAMILSKFLVLVGCQNGVSGSESWFLVAAAEQNSCWKTIEPPSVFRLEGNLYARREAEKLPGVAKPPPGAGLVGLLLGWV